MPSTDPRHRGQRGVSLVESLVAAALLGLTVMTGMTAWDTAIMSGRQAVHEAWARCVARAEMEAVLNAPFSDNPTNYASPVGVTVSVGNKTGDPDLRQVTVVVSGSGVSGYRLDAMKARATSGNTPVNPQEVLDGCPPP